MSFAPLAGTRVLDLTGSLAGPHCTEVLAALGADVVKVERPEGGDETRAWGPPFAGGQGVLFLTANAGKRSLALRVNTPEGRDVVLHLAERVDVFVQSLRPGLVQRYGLGPEELRRRNPRLVYCSIGAFGRTGPLRDAPGYDPLLQAAAGIMSVTGEPGGSSVRVGTSLVDFETGMWAALGIVAALHQRERTGRGCMLDTSLYETAIGLMSYHLTGFLASGEVPGRHGTAFPLIAPYQAFATADGEIMVAAPNDRLFAALGAALGLNELTLDPRFQSNPQRVEHREELIALLADRFAQEPTAVWLERLGRTGVPVAPVQDVAAVATHEQTEALELLQPAGEATIVSPPLSADGKRLRHELAPPRLGEHSAAVLAEAGYSDEEVRSLLSAGIVRLPA